MEKKQKRKLKIILLAIVILLLLVSCGEGQILGNTDKLVSEMTKEELLWSVLAMSIIGSAIGS